VLERPPVVSPSTELGPGPPGPLSAVADGGLDGLRLMIRTRTGAAGRPGTVPVPVARRDLNFKPESSSSHVSSELERRN
jgi:hypothetical protein